jgi:hypothetical protein
MEGRILEEVLRAILENFYVDDYLDSFNTIAEARKVKIELTEVLGTGGLTLMRWKSNHPGVLEDEESLEDDSVMFKEVGNIKIFEDHRQVFEKLEKVLGVSYSFDKDVFSIQINDKYKQSVTTRRQMMGLSSCVFDPLGFFCPFVLKGKLWFHKATNLGLLWDDALPEDIRVAFDEWRRRLPELQNFQIPRWVATPETAGGEEEIHTFCDASEEGALYMNALEHLMELHLHH